MGRAATVTASGPSGSRRTSLAAAVLAATLAAAPALAEQPRELGVAAHSGAAAPMLMTFQRPNRHMEITGVAEDADGVLWITGFSEDREQPAGVGYLAAIARDGGLQIEHETALPGHRVTQFWWPAPLADGSVAVAVALDPFSARPDGAVAILSRDGQVLNQVLLTDLGLAGGDIVHVELYPDRDLAVTGSARLGPQVSGAMAARLRPDLSAVWVATEGARDRGYTLSAYASTVLRDGSLVAIGTATRPEGADGYGWLARFDRTGRVLWRQWLTGGMAELLEDAAQIYGNWVAESPGGDIAYLQSSYDEFGRPLTHTLVRRSLAGHIVSQIPLTFADELELTTMGATRDGDVIVAGAAGTGAVPIIARIGSGGSVRWSQRLEELPGGFVWGVAETTDGTIVAVGAYFPYGRTTGSGWVVRLGSDGSRP